jgi:hypothetical protein
MVVVGFGIGLLVIVSPASSVPYDPQRPRGSLSRDGIEAVQGSADLEKPAWRVFRVLIRRRGQVMMVLIHIRSRRWDFAAEMRLA